MFLVGGLISLVSKSSRFIFLLLSLEMLIMSMLFYNLPMLNELNFTLMMVFSVSSSVIGLIMLVNSISQYGSEYVKF